eukprot:scaffold2858_cov659-Pavlova_lutheri.AAC.192
MISPVWRLFVSCRAYCSKKPSWKVAASASRVTSVPTLPIVCNTRERCLVCPLSHANRIVMAWSVRATDGFCFSRETVAFPEVNPQKFTQGDTVPRFGEVDAIPGTRGGGLIRSTRWDR